MLSAENEMLALTPGPARSSTDRVDADGVCLTTAPCWLRLQLILARISAAEGAAADGNNREEHFLANFRLAGLQASRR